MRQVKSNEQYLFLYLSLMLSIFSLLLALTVTPSEGISAEPPRERDVEELKFEAPRLVHMPFALFTKDQVTVDEVSFSNVKELLFSHNVRAELHLLTGAESPEQRYAQALTLQYRLWKAGLHPEDVIVQVRQVEDNNERSILVLYPEDPAQL